MFRIYFSIWHRKSCSTQKFTFSSNEIGTHCFTALKKHRKVDQFKMNVIKSIEQVQLLRKRRKERRKKR